MERWIGLLFNFKWPHDGFTFGIGFEVFEYSDDYPWSSLVIRCLFATVIVNVGYGIDAAEKYNNQAKDN
jgi:hypothetical protein